MWNGKNGKKIKKRDLTKSKLRLKNFTKRMIKFGTILTCKKIIIGNKNIMLTLFNGK